MPDVGSARDCGFVVDAATIARMIAVDSTKQIQTNRPPSRRRFGGGDTLGLLSLLVVTAIAAQPIVVGGTMVGQDTAAFFYPIFSAMGERLRAGDVPGWNPAQFSGVPFAADPESGWMYLPAMLFFSLFPLAIAAKIWLVFHLLLAATGTYALARLLGIGAIGATVAALSYQLSGLMYARTICCPAYSQVVTWLPILLVAVEMSFRSENRRHLIAWLAAAGLCLSQIFVAWLGQGAYYTLFAFSSYIGYRSLFAPPLPNPPVRQRLVRCAVTGIAPVAIAAAMAAAAILPRIEYLPRTNLAEGYTGTLSWAAILGGWDPLITARQLLNPTFYYAGAATLCLATIGVIVGRGRHLAPYFTFLTLGTLVLAQRDATWFHHLLYRLPRFEELHRHWPERDMVIFYLGPAMLAGIAVDALRRLPSHRRIFTLATLAASLAAVVVAARYGPIDGTSLRFLFFVSATLLVAGHLTFKHRWLIGVLLALFVAIDLLNVGQFNTEHGLYGGFHKSSEVFPYQAPAAAEWLKARTDATGEPARYVGYDPGIHRGGTTPKLYRYSFSDPRAGAIMVNNRATAVGLQDIQGYNPIQPRRYVDFMAELNGFVQEYHEANIYAKGLESPLLPLLNAQAIVIPAEFSPDRTDLVRLTERYPTVFADDEVRILDNTDALPRAWLVRDVRQAAADETLTQLGSGSVDPRQVAFVDADPPLLSPGAPTRNDEVEIVTWEPDRLQIRVVAESPALLVVSENADPNWRASIDGRATPILTANHIQRAVTLPAGEHLVEMRYDSPTLRWGSYLSSLSFALGAIIWLQPLYRRWTLPHRSRLFSVNKP